MKQTGKISNCKTRILLIPAFSIFLLLFACNTEENTKAGFLTQEQAQANIDAIIANIREPKIPSDTINLIEFSGLSPDAEGTEDFYPFIKLALEELEKRGGGWLLFPNTDPLNSWIRYTETYRIEGPIHLKDNSGLILDRSIKLFFPFNPEKYLISEKGTLTRYEGTTIYSFSPLIYAFDAKNIAIVARGETGNMPVIDGDGEKWQRWMWEGELARQDRGLQASYQLLKDVNNQDVPIAQRVYTDPENDYFRPETMEFFLCENVLVDGIKIDNSPFWCIKPVFSQSCTFRNLAFDAFAVNNDGVDPESSNNVLIENIMFANHDDNVAIKAGRDKEGRDGAIVAGTELENIESEYIKDGRITGPTENVVIRNNLFYGHYAICIGSEMSGGVRNIYAVDNTSVKSVNMGVFIKSSRLRGGTVENVYVNGLELNNVKNEVIAIVPNYDKADESPYPPTIKNVQIENVSSNSSKAGVLVHGWYDEPVTNIFLKNIKLKNVETNPLQVEQSKNVTLESVTINNQSYNKTINSLDEGEAPPEKI